jgi:hypothetical protein
MSACVGSGTGGSGSSQSGSTTYTLTVTATSGNISVPTTHSNGEELRNTEAMKPRLLEGFADAGAGFLQLFGQAGDLALKVG